MTIERIVILLEPIENQKKTNYLILPAFGLIIINFIIYLILTLNTEIPNIDCPTYGCLFILNYYFGCFTRYVEMLLNCFIVIFGLWFYIIYKQYMSFSNLNKVNFY